MMKIDNSATFQIMDKDLQNITLEKGPSVHEARNDAPTDQVSIQYRKSNFPSTKEINTEDVQQAMDNFKTLAASGTLDQIHSNLSIERVMRLLQPRI